MKKILFILLVLISQNAFGQVEKPINAGNYIIGGSGSLGYSKFKSPSGINDYFTSNTGISLSPMLGYFISRGLAIGIQPTLSMRYYRYYNNFNSSDSKYLYVNIGVGPFAKYYFDSGFLLSLTTGLTGSLRYDLDAAAIEKSTTSFSIDLSPGFGYAYFINPFVSLEAVLEYAYSVDISKQVDGTNNQLNLSLRLCVFM